MQDPVPEANITGWPCYCRDRFPKCTVRATDLETSSKPLGNKQLDLDKVPDEEAKIKNREKTFRVEEVHYIKTLAKKKSFGQCTITRK